jgi:hypothetical protein
MKKQPLHAEDFIPVRISETALSRLQMVAISV